MSDLAKRLLACPRFRWMLGMQIVNRDDSLALTWRIVHCHKNWLTLWDERSIIERPAKALADDDLFPDLTDPATLGCLLALVREAGWPDMYATTQDGTPGGEWWVVCTSEGDIVAGGSTEAGALVAALEAA